MCCDKPATLDTNIVVATFYFKCKFAKGNQIINSLLVLYKSLFFNLYRRTL